MSCGLAVSLKADESLSALLKESDTALYLAKAEGRNRVQRADRHRPAGGPSTVIRVA